MPSKCVRPIANGMAKAKKNRKLKIGLVLDDGLDSPDGVQQYVLRIGEWLVSQGHEVHYLVGQTRRLDLANVHSLSRNVGVVFNGNRLTIPMPAAKDKIRRLLENENFDVLHVQLPFSPWLAGRVIDINQGRAAVFGTFHILPNSKLSLIGSRLLYWWTRRLWFQFDKTVSVSSAAQKFARKVYKTNSSVLPNAFDYGRFNSAKPLKNGKELNILFLGRLVKRKGCKQLLKAINRLKQSDLPDFTVTICGRGPLLARLKQYTRRHHLNNVDFAGFISEEDKPRYLASADIAIFPSLGGESFGIVLLEAMASGRTCVLAGDNPGYRSTMVPRPELLFDPKNTGELAELLSRYLRNPTKRQNVAAWAGNYAKQFDVNKVGMQLITEYKKLLAGKNVQ